jgi:excisionase family DNA binding protein
MLLSVVAAARELAVSVSKVRTLIRSGALPTVRIGRRVLIRSQALERFVRDAERGRTGIPVSGSSRR